MSTDLSTGSPGDLFVGLQQPTTDDTTYQVDLIHMGKQEGADGDTMLQSSLNDSETMGEFIFPPEVGTEAYEREMLNSTQPDEGQIFPDKALMNSSSEAAQAAKLGITPEQLAAEKKNYGEFASAALAKGEDPELYAHLVEIAMSTLGLDPPFDSMSPEDQNTLLEAVLQGKAEGEEEAQGANKTPGQTEKGNKIKEIRAQLDKLKKGDGKAFAAMARSKGFSPSKFSELANKHMDDIGMPFAGYTPEQRMHVIFELLINETQGKMPDGSTVESVPTQKKQILFEAMKTDIAAGKASADSAKINQNPGGSGGGPGIQASSATEKSYLQAVSGSGATTGTGGINPWFASTPMTCFAIAFLEVVKILMENKREQGVLQLQAMNRIGEIAKIAVKYEVKMAELAVKNAMAQATAAALAIGMCVLSIAAQVTFAARKKSEPTERDHVLDQGFSKLSTSEQEASMKALSQSKRDIKTTDEGVTKAKTKQLESKTKHEEKQAALKQAESEVANAEQKIRDIKATAGSTPQDLESPQDELRVANQKADKARTEEFAAKSDRETADKAVIDAEAKQAKARTDADAAGQIHHFHLESDAAFQTRKAKVAAHNHEMDQKSYTAMALGQTSNSAQQLITQTVAAQTAMQQGQVKAGQALIEAWKQIAKHSLDQATQAFNANSDSISAFLSALRDLGAMVQRAMSAVIK